MDQDISQTIPWPIDEVDEEAVMYRQIHHSAISITKPIPPASGFSDFDLSCNWNRYSNPEKSRELIGLQLRFDKSGFKNPNDFYICSIEVEKIKGLYDDIAHKPVFNYPEVYGKPNNRSHCLINGDKKKRLEQMEVRSLIAKKAKWEIFDLYELNRVRLEQNK